ncbi:MAG: type II toxin-antitoxin system VapC family toxin [Deltaproteobacteria bacterium]|nr:type II toxin-antitoxin system VapC family toxin [Deltaproteobacteria bacterium]
MIILDTNVVSELIRTSPSEVVLRWTDRQPPQQLFISAVTEAELRVGVAILPDGRRKQMIAARVDEMLSRVFSGRTLAFDSAAAVHYANLIATRRLAGRPLMQADAQIIATAAAHRASVATRNVRDFEGSGVAIIDPWSSLQ